MSGKTLYFWGWLYLQSEATNLKRPHTFFGIFRDPLIEKIGCDLVRRFYPFWPPGRRTIYDRTWTDAGWMKWIDNHIEPWWKLKIHHAYLHDIVCNKLGICFKCIIYTYQLNFVKKMIALTFLNLYMTYMLWYNLVHYVQCSGMANPSSNLQSYQKVTGI